MLPQNDGRRKAIYELWDMEYTIDEVSLRLNIPRSSVGYYVRKFNKSFGRGRIPSPVKDQTNK